jgi:hypothetical protein
VAVARRSRGTTAERGYGGAHQAARARMEPLVLAGGVLCARCGQPILPGQHWDLGHVDGDKSRYAGPEHRTCNRGTSGRRVLLVAEPSRTGWG